MHLFSKKILYTVELKIVPVKINGFKCIKVDSHQHTSINVPKMQKPINTGSQ